MIYDAIFIGASPVNVLEAICLKQQGFSVAVIDMTDRFGGAWKVAEFAGHDNVDIGPHFFMTAYDRHHFLKKLGVELVPFKQKWIYNHRVFGRFARGPITNRLYNLLESILIPVTFLKGILRGGVDRSSMDYKMECLKAFLTVDNMNNVYFRNGTVDFLNCIEELIAKCELEVRYETTVDRIHKTELFNVYTNTGEVLRGENLYITGRAQIIEFVHDREVIETTFKKNIPLFVQLKLGNCEPLPCDFLRFYEYDRMIMLADVTRFIADISSVAERVLVLRVRDIETEADVNDLILRLKNDNIIPASSILHAWKMHTYDTTTLKSLDDLRKVPGLHIVEADSLSKALCLYAPKWLAAGITNL
jgi:putative NAD(P)-binding protein